MPIKNVSKLNERIRDKIRSRLECVSTSLHLLPHQRCGIAVSAPGKPGIFNFDFEQTGGGYSFIGTVDTLNTVNASVDTTSHRYWHRRWPGPPVLLMIVRWKPGRRNLESASANTRRPVLSTKQLVSDPAAVFQPGRVVHDRRL